jgi:hypothetical protein
LKILFSAGFVRSFSPKRFIRHSPPVACAARCKSNASWTEKEGIRNDHRNARIRRCRVVGAGTAGFHAPNWTLVGINFVKDTLTQGLGAAATNAFITIGAPLFD